MTVQELIDRLMKIEDKNQEVLVKNFGGFPSKARIVANGSVNYEGVLQDAEKRIVIE